MQGNWMRVPGWFVGCLLSSAMLGRLHSVVDARPSAPLPCLTVVVACSPPLPCRIEVPAAWSVARLVCGFGVHAVAETAFASACFALAFRRALQNPGILGAGIARAVIMFLLPLTLPPSGRPAAAAAGRGAAAATGRGGADAATSPAVGAGAVQQPETSAQNPARSKVPPGVFRVLDSSKSTVAKPASSSKLVACLSSDIVACATLACSPCNLARSRWTCQHHKTVPRRTRKPPPSASITNHSVPMSSPAVLSACDPPPWKLGQDPNSPKPQKRQWMPWPPALQPSPPAWSGAA